MRNIQFYVLLSPVEGVHQNEMSRLGKSVDDFMELKLQVVRGRPTIKSMQMSSHFQIGILRGCNNPVGLK
jgi:hypothetical protein